MIAVAGSGKTSYLVSEALKVENENVLLLTFTDSNCDEIKQKIIKKKKFMPSNVFVKTWFSFLLQHGVRPYQSVLDSSLDLIKVGFFLYQGKSAQYSAEDDVMRHYFTKDMKIYSDKISKFVYKSDQLSFGEVMIRLVRIYPNIFIDEVQDLAGWDLDLLKLLFDGNSRILLVGDPRQAIYDTNDSPKYRKYKGSGIQRFIEEKCVKGSCLIDVGTLANSHRNNAQICNFSSKLYPELPQANPCDCVECRVHKDSHEGIFLVRKSDIKEYLEEFTETIQLRLNIIIKDVIQNYPAINFGLSKGLSFERVLIYPTVDMQKWIIDHNHDLTSTTRAQLYVGITRARYSVGIVYDYDNTLEIEGIKKYKV